MDPTSPDSAVLDPTALPAKEHIESDEPAEIAHAHDIYTTEQSFGIRLVDTPQGRNKASMLIQKMYSWRGFSGDHALVENAFRVSLMAHSKGEPIGTLTLGLDTPDGLLADELFRHEIEPYRQRGARICEFIKLAFDMDGDSKAYLASLFHLMVIFARDIHKCSHIFIEVRPNHRKFFGPMLGFRQLGDEVVNPRVNTRGILMVADLREMTQQIQTHGGKGPDAGVRSFFPLFFSPREEAGIIQRIHENR